MYGYDYSGGLGSSNSLISSNTAAGLAGVGIWALIAFILALVGCFLVYFLFVTKKENPSQKFLAWLKEFLAFKKMLIEPILKICYIFGALFTTLISFGFIGQSFLVFFLTLTLGNVVLRLVYEMILIKIMIWKNTTEINKKLDK